MLDSSEDSCHGVRLVSRRTPQADTRSEAEFHAADADRAGRKKAFIDYSAVKQIIDLTVKDYLLPFPDVSREARTQIRFRITLEYRDHLREEDRIEQRELVIAGRIKIKIEVELSRNPFVHAKAERVTGNTKRTRARPGVESHVIRPQRTCG